MTFNNCITLQFQKPRESAYHISFQNNESYRPIPPPFVADFVSLLKSVITEWMIKLKIK